MSSLPQFREPWEYAEDYHARGEVPPEQDDAERIADLERALDERTSQLEDANRKLSRYRCPRCHDLVEPGTVPPRLARIGDRVHLACRAYPHCMPYDEVPL